MEIPATETAKIGIFLKQKNPFKAIRRNKLKISGLPVMIKDIFLSPLSKSF
jgi:hypothetical protein